jgi:uncharacterized protein YndB with AHSA1/START domain
MKDEIVRSIVICARRATVFRFLAESELFAAWCGAGSTIEAGIGGAVRIVFPGGTSASGVVRELVPGERIAYSYGYDRPDPPIAPGASTVAFALADAADGTQVTLRHGGLPGAEILREHVQGWRFQLSLLSGAVTAHQHASAPAMIDGWFAAWNLRDAQARRAALADCCAPDVGFRDRFGLLVGHDDLDAQIAASAVHMPGLVMRRAGDVRHTQGVALCAWEAVSGDKVAARGHNVFDLAPDGRIARVVGFWS